ncbi:MAG: hypothetical protein FK734_06635 [Asgard group archaeon]|nr:hypothetical protein [Asgard group archaeon]
MTWHEGDRVWANWPDDDFWYSGIIQKIEGHNYDILFDDGYKLTLKEHDIKQIDISIGMKVLAKWQGKGAYYFAKILERNGDSYLIEYDDDKSKEWLPIGMLAIT